MNDIDSPFDILDTLHVIITFTRSHIIVRPLFCINKTINKILSQIYNTNSKIPCLICHEFSDIFCVSHRQYKPLIKFHVKYFYQGICEHCLATAVSAICHICHIDFMMHNQYHGNKPKCGNCSNGYIRKYHKRSIFRDTNDRMKNIKNIIILHTDDFPYSIARLTLT